MVAANTGPKKRNPMVLRKGLTIGGLGAETDDEFLFDCFSYLPAFDKIADTSSPGMVLAGRTGAGKTAIIRFINKEKEYVSEIDLSDISLSYVANSDAVKFLEAIGADLHLLFQALWKHVICIEFIRLFYRVDTETKSRSIFSQIFDAFKAQPRKKKALDYLRSWEGKFWITMDQNIKELTERLDEQARAEFGADIEKFKAGGHYEKRLSTDKKTEIVSRFRKIVSSDQLNDLSNVIEILSEQASHDDMKKFYILIDKLDEHWVDAKVRFKLIRALLESLRQFRKITNLKIVVALRVDILERVLQETDELTAQREKIEEYFVRLDWNKKELKDLVEKRVQLLFKRQYTQESVKFDDIFSAKVGKDSAFDYIVERTLLRPRDLISFVNYCFNNVDGHEGVPARSIKDAEYEYSRTRKLALEEEWRSAFPSLPLCFEIISGLPGPGLDMKSLLESNKVSFLSQKILSRPKIDYDPLYDAASSTSESSNEDFSKKIVSLLYRVGAIGVKLQSSDRFRYSHIDQPVIESSVLNGDVRLRVHPMLHRALNIGERENQSH